MRRATINRYILTDVLITTEDDDDDDEEEEIIQIRCECGNKERFSFTHMNKH